MDDFEEYLNNRFGNCEILSDGTYYVNNDGNHYYFSPDCTEGNVNLTVCYPGQGGLGNSNGTNPHANWNSELNSTGIPPGNVLIISGSENNTVNGYVDNLSIIDDICENTGIDISSAQFQGFSGSGGFVVTETGRYLMKHPDLVKETAIIDVDGYMFEYPIRNNPEAAIFIRDNKVPIYMVTPPDTYVNRVKKLTTNFINSDFNTYFVELTKKEFYIDHGKSAYVVLKDGFCSYIGGVSNELGSLVGYKAYEYKDGQFIEVDLEGIRTINTIEQDDLVGILDENEFTFEEIPNNFKSNNNSLLTLSEFDISYKGPSGVMSSNMQYLESFANNVIGSLREDSLFSSLSLSASGGCGPLIEPINECLNLYYDTVGELVNKLTQETEGIVSIGQSIADMDVYLRERSPEDAIKNGISPLHIFGIDIDEPNNVPEQSIGEKEIITEEGEILDDSDLDDFEEDYITEEGEF